MLKSLDFMWVSSIFTQSGFTDSGVTESGNVKYSLSEQVGTTAAATGTLNPMFGQVMAEEISNGTYAGGNVTVNSDILNVDFEGVGGDEHNVVATMTITKKDSTAFAEGTDQLLYAGDKVKYDFEEDMNITVSRPLIDQIRNSDYCDTNGFVDYTFEYDYTLKITVTYSDDDCNLIGETMNIKADGLTIWEKAEKEYCNNGDILHNLCCRL